MIIAVFICFVKLSKTFDKLSAVIEERRVRIGGVGERGVALEHTTCARLSSGSDKHNESESKNRENNDSEDSTG